MRGAWLVAGSDINEPYPCMCHGQRACGRRCPCLGRRDVETMPQLCCGRRAVEAAERKGLQ